MGGLGLMVAVLGATVLHQVMRFGMVSAQPSVPLSETAIKALSPAPS